MTNAVVENRERHECLRWAAAFLTNSFKQHKIDAAWKRHNNNSRGNSHGTDQNNCID
jgi:hypothetical protein